MNQKIRDRLIRTCAWCLQTIPEDSEVFGFGAKARKGVDLSDKEGEFVSLELALAKKTVFALVATAASRAKEEGYDLVFINCSEACAAELKDALEFERDVYEENIQVWMTRLASMKFSDETSEPLLRPERPFGVSLLTVLDGSVAGLLPPLRAIVQIVTA